MTKSCFCFFFLLNEESVISLCAAMKSICGGVAGLKSNDRGNKMKKVAVLMLLAIMATGCFSTRYHNGRDGVQLAGVERIKVLPMQAEIQPGSKISGEAVCEKWFFVFKKEPSKQTYGLPLQNEEGFVAPDSCRRGAIYNALEKHPADTLIAPHYKSVTLKELCLFGIQSLCLHEKNTVVVTGYQGTFKNIRTMPEDIIKFQWKADALKNK